MIRVQSEADLAEAILSAQAPIRICGGGTRPIGVPVDAQALTTAGLSGIELYEPGALTLVARAGTPLAEVEETLAAENQRLAFEPMDHRPLLGTSGTPTIGGVVAANVSGPRRVQVGACRDHLLGVRFVDGQGRVLKNGGRVMKNVTGYDLVKLMAGSFGTLGVLSEVALKVLPRSETEATLVRDGLEPRAAIAALSAALGSPFEITGAAHVEAPSDGAGPRSMIRIEGMAQSVDYRAGRLAEKGWQRLEGGADNSRASWRALRDVAPFAQQEGAVWRLSLKPSDAPEVSAALRAGGLEHAAIYDWGGGLLWMLTEDAADCGAAAIRAQTRRRGGHATLLRARPETRAQLPVFEPAPEPLARIAAGLRARFDPRAILNPGLMG